MTAPELVVTLDVAVRRCGEVERYRAAHVLAGGTVRAARAGVGGVTSARVPVERWRAELAGLCRVVVPPDAPPAPEDRPDLPWDLVVGSGAALAARRPEVYDELAWRADALQRRQLLRLHRGSVGRLRAVGIIPSGRRVGWVSWVLVADGWRALTPYLSSATRMVRLERRRPEDLADEVARWLWSRR